MNTVLMIVLAMGIDAAIGWPDALYRRIGHPVTWMARGITALDTALNHAGLGARVRQMRGGLTVLILCAVTWGIAAFLQDALPDGIIGAAIGAGRSAGDRGASETWRRRRLLCLFKTQPVTLVLPWRHRSAPWRWQTRNKPRQTGIAPRSRNPGRWQRR